MMLSKSSDLVEPCIRCDSDTLKVLNKHAAETRCVGVRFRMNNFCSRCECKNFADKIAKAQCTIGEKFERLGLGQCCNTREVCIGIPLATYGTIDRAYQAARVANKGSDFRAHGTLVSHLSLVQAPEMVRISLMRWVPYALNKAFSGKAHVILPPDAVEGISGIYSDFREVKVLENAFQNRVTPVIKRLRNLRSDENLTLEGSMLMRKTQSRIREEVLILLNREGTDDVFKLGLVELQEKFSSKPDEAVEEHVAYATERSQILDARILEIQVDMQKRVDDISEKFGKLKNMYVDLLKQQANSNSSEFAAEATNLAAPRYDKHFLGAARPKDKGPNKCGFSAKNKKQRRKSVVENRDN